MKRSPLTARLRVSLPGADRALVHYVGLGGDLQPVAVCDVSRVVESVREFLAVHCFDRYDVGFSGDLAALEQVRRALPRVQWSAGARQ